MGKHITKKYLFAMPKVGKKRKNKDAYIPEISLSYEKDFPKFVFYKLFCRPTEMYTSESVYLY